MMRPKQREQRWVSGIVPMQGQRMGIDRRTGEARRFFFLITLKPIVE